MAVAAFRLKRAGGYSRFHIFQYFCRDFIIKYIAVVSRLGTRMVPSAAGGSYCENNATSVMIHLENLHKTYHNGAPLHVLKGIELDIEKGEFVSIMGASGSGKSTLLNILGILDNYDSGEYRLNGVLIKDLSETKAAEYRNRMIGFIFQSFNLISFKNALENVALPLYYQGVSRKSAMRWPCSIWRNSVSRSGPTICPTSSPADRNSAWPSRAPSSRGRKSSWPTNLQARWTAKPRWR